MVITPGARWRPAALSSRESGRGLGPVPRKPSTAPCPTTWRGRRGVCVRTAAPLALAEEPPLPHLARLERGLGVGGGVQGTKLCADSAGGFGIGAAAWARWTDTRGIYVPRRRAQNEQVPGQSRAALGGEVTEGGDNAGPEHSALPWMGSGFHEAAYPRPLQQRHGQSCLPPVRSGQVPHGPWAPSTGAPAPTRGCPMGPEELQGSSQREAQESAANPPSSSGAPREGRSECAPPQPHAL